jgi:hypothetical protein
MLFDFAKSRTDRASIPIHLFIEEAHRYVVKDNDVFLIGYNIFERIAKEGRKYGVILDLISQRPVEISETVIAQCSNFLIFKMTHPKDIEYIRTMLPNISADVIEKQKILQPGNCVGFGGAFKLPMVIKMEMPNPAPNSNSCNVNECWGIRGNNSNTSTSSNTSNYNNNNSDINNGGGVAYTDQVFESQVNTQPVSVPQNVVTEQTAPEENNTEEVEQIHQNKYISVLYVIMVEMFLASS